MEIISLWRQHWGRLARRPQRYGIMNAQGPQKGRCGNCDFKRRMGGRIVVVDLTYRFTVVRCHLCVRV